MEYPAERSLTLCDSKGMDVAVTHVQTRFLRDFVELTKPRVVAMVLVTTLVGFYLGASSFGAEPLLLLWTLVGTGLAAGGTLALNQYMERDHDAQMRRTRARPLPSGRLQPEEALWFGAALVVVGLGVLWSAVNALSAIVTAATTVSYLFAYTPLKRRTSLCSIVGAVPGALPPVTGWAAARGGLGDGAAILFAILFLWQLPHSLAIAKLYADDYGRAGFRLLPVVDPDGGSTERQIVSNCAALFVVGLLPTVLGLAGEIYFVCAFVLGGLFLLSSLQLLRAPCARGARRVLLASLLYLPILLAVMAADKTTS